MITPTNLLELGASLPVDTDHSLRSIEKGHLLLINLKPQTYKPETHKGQETIIAFKGQFSLETAEGSVQVNEGESITVPPGVEHWFGEASDALILVVFG